MPTSKLQRTDIDGFLRAVGNELQAASSFLDRTTPFQPGACTQPQLLLPAPQLRLAARPTSAAAVRSSSGDRNPWASSSYRPHAAGASTEVAAPTTEVASSNASRSSGSSSSSSSSSSGGRAECGDDGEVAALMSLLAAGPAAEATGPAQESGTAVAAEQQLVVAEDGAHIAGAQSAEPVVEPELAANKQAAAGGPGCMLVAGHVPQEQPPQQQQPAQQAQQPARQAEQQPAQQAQQHPAQQQKHRDRHSKVLAWLRSPGASYGPGVPGSPAPNSIPAVHAACAVPAASPPPARRPRSPLGPEAAGSKFRHRDASSKPVPAPHRFPQHPQPLAAEAQTAARRAQAPQPSGYCEQLARPGWQPQRLVLARLPCSACGREEADCCCGTAPAAPLRLLRPLQLSCPSPVRSSQQRRMAGCFGGAPGARAAEQACTHQRPLAPVPVPVPLRASQPRQQQQQGQGSGAISIGSIQTAYFGGGHFPAPPGAWQQAAPAEALPVKAPHAAAVLPAPAPVASLLDSWSSRGAAAASATAAAGPFPQRDLWRAAYLARKLPAGMAALHCPGQASNGNGAMGRLRAIAQRIHGMQGDITSFLQQQHSHPALPVGQVGNQLNNAGTARREAVPRGHASAVPAAAAAGKHAASRSRGHNTAIKSSAAGPGPAAEAADPFSDDAVLTILTGTDFAWRQQAALAAAAAEGRKALPPDQAQQATEQVPAAKSGAVQRLKEAQLAAVAAVRVGRQARVGQRTAGKPGSG